MVKLFDLVSGPVIVLCMYVVGLEQLAVILPCQWSLVIVICLCFAGLEQIFDLVIAVHFVDLKQVFNLAIGVRWWVLARILQVWSNHSTLSMESGDCPLLV